MQLAMWFYSPTFSFPPFSFNNNKMQRSFELREELAMEGILRLDKILPWFQSEASKIENLLVTFMRINPGGLFIENIEFCLLYSLSLCEQASFHHCFLVNNIDKLGWTFSTFLSCTLIG
jgi:hypothetical protein